MPEQDDFFYATKVWTQGAAAGKTQIENSYRLMKRQTMDLIQIHNLVDWQTHLRYLRELKEQGRLKYIGITHYQDSSHEALADVVKKEQIDFVQFNYSIATRDAEKRLLPLAKDKGIATIINEPLEKGRLFDKAGNKPLPSWAGDYGIESWSGYFLKYIISNSAVTCVIPASSNPKHMHDNLKAGEGAMPDEQGRKKLADYFDCL